MAAKRISLAERKQIEELYNEKGYTPKEIAAHIGRGLSAIYYELRRGLTTNTNKYGLKAYSAILADRHAKTAQRWKTYRGDE